MKNLIMMMMFLTGLTMLTTHPLMMSLIIIIQAINISLLTSMYMYIMFKSEYNHKIELLLSDATVYKILNKDTTYSFESKTNALIKTLLNKKYVTNEVYQNLIIHNSTPFKIYGLVKTHKLNNPLSPIISNIQSHSKFLVKYLSSILRTSFKLFNSYSLTDTFEFVDKINSCVVNTSNKLVSFDVVNLFTNIPTDLVLKMINQNWHLIQAHIKMSKTVFIEILFWIFNSVYFTFNNKFYQQTSGAPMESSLSLIIADIIMTHIMNHVISNSSFNFDFFFQYVDDLVCMFPCEYTECPETLLTNEDWSFLS